MYLFFESSRGWHICNFNTIHLELLYLFLLRNSIWENGLFVITCRSPSSLPLYLSPPWIRQLDEKEAWKTSIFCCFLTKFWFQANGSFLRLLLLGLFVHSSLLLDFQTTYFLAYLFTCLQRWMFAVTILCSYWSNLNWS